MFLSSKIQHIVSTVPFPIIRTLLNKNNVSGKSDEEKKELMRQIEGACLRFDRSGTGALTVDQVRKG
jgi:hypothetical protein